MIVLECVKCGQHCACTPQEKLARVEALMPDADKFKHKRKNSDQS